jgi:GntR family transcriptional regulator/MocR family aminotransferase
MARGVKVQPLSWHSQRPHRPGLVLGYAANPPTAITAGIAALGEVARQIVKDSGRSPVRSSVKRCTSASAGR